MQNTISANKAVSCQSTTRLKSPAKVNLGLSVVGRRSDGYHLLESIFWPLNWYDEIEIQREDHGQNSVQAIWLSDAPCPHQPVPQDNKNIVSSVLDEWNQEKDRSWKVHLGKRIPIGAGLGGGSSNAGTVLGYLNTYHSHKVLDPSKFGADVPFFLNPVPSWVSGIGDICAPLSIEPSLVEQLVFLIVVPPQPLSTQTVFDAFRSQKITFSEKEKKEPTDIITYLSAAKNDLEFLAVKDYPLIGKTLTALRQSPCLYASISGSGSACVAVYKRKDIKTLKGLREKLRRDDCTTIEASTHGVG